jgi:hypothetical protein
MSRKPVENAATNTQGTNSVAGYESALLSERVFQLPHLNGLQISTSLVELRTGVGISSTETGTGMC